METAMRTKSAICCILAVLILGLGAMAQELPKPTYQNSFIVAIEHPVWDTTEVAYMKSTINFGLYAWLSLSYNHIPSVLDWHWDLNDALNGIQFKDVINVMVDLARSQNVHHHFVLCDGLARNLPIYYEAKVEDIRNCQ